MDINEVILTDVIIQKYADDLLTYILKSTEAPSTLPQEIANQKMHSNLRLKYTDL